MGIEISNSSIPIKQDKKVSAFGANLAALGALAGVRTAGVFCNSFLNKISNKVETSCDKYISVFHNAGENVLERYGLADEIHIQYLNKDTPLPEGHSPDLNCLQQVKAGQNAFYTHRAMIDISTQKELVKANTIILPENNKATDIFHEMGHAVNNVTSKNGKFILKAKPVCKPIPLLLGMYVLMTRKSKPDENGNYTSGQKVNNFIRKNVFTLTFASFLPLFTDEIMADIKGGKLAKGVLKPEFIKMYNKTSRIAFLTYLTAACFSAFTILAMRKTKDKILEKKEAKQEI